jgi:hypothetical protein
MAVHPPLIYAGYGDGVIRVWKNGVCKGRYQAHTGEIRVRKRKTIKLINICFFIYFFLFN